MAGVGVKIIVRNNDGDLVQLANYIHREGWEVVQNAEEGSVGMSTLYLEDIDESIWDTLGLNDGARRQIRLVDYQSNKIVQFGYTGRRSIRRRYDDYGNPLGRAWAIEIWDPNTVIQRRVLTHHGAKRPRETDVERIQWLITAHEWDIVGQFIIGTDHPKTMSKADYRGQMVADVISDCSQHANKNYWLDIVDDGAGDRLTFWYGKDNRDYYSSTISISNDLADLDVAALGAGTATLVYPPANDTEYQMDPSRIFTGVEVDWEKGKVYRHSITGDTQFERWDTVIQAPNIHEKDRAIDRAENMIERLADEDVRIESGILITATQAHLVRAGMRIPVKLTHIPEMTDYVDCRILSRGLQPRGDGYRYWMPLTLEPIGTSSAPVTSCSTALGALVGASQSDQFPLSVSMSITPGVQSFIVGAAVAANHNSPADTAMTISGGGTQMYSYGGSAHPAYAVAYTDDPSPTTMTGSYTGGNNYANDSTWASAMVAVDTNATTPVQHAHDDFVGTSTMLVTLSSPPTAGNMIILAVGWRDFTGVTDTDSNLRPADGNWVSVATGTAESNRTGTGVHDSDSVQIFARCVADGDGSDYGFAGLSKASRISVIEVAIT